MKARAPALVSRLEDLPNVGRATAADLRLIGITHPRDLTGADPLALYERLCAVSGKRHDPCVIDVFMSIVHFMDEGEARPWWSFTKTRKERLNRKNRKGMG